MRTAPNVGKSCDHERFTQLVRGHEPRLRAYILAMVPSWNDAEDIYQATCAQLWQEIDRLQGEERFGAWAAKIAYFQVLSHRKHLSRSKLSFSGGFVDAVGADGVKLCESASPRREALARCLDRLDPQQRQLVDLRYVHNRPLPEIASSMEKSLEATYQVLSRIRRLLRHCVERELSAEEQQ